METNELNSLLRSLRFFRDFTDDEISELVALCERQKVKAGDVIVRQDDHGDSMYIVTSGRVRVVHHRDGNYIQLAELKPGEFFGEIAVVDHGPRCADVQSLEESTLLEVSQAAVSALAGVYPNAAFKFVIAIGRVMVERLRSSNQRYVDTLLFPMSGQ